MDFVIGFILFAIMLTDPETFAVLILLGIAAVSISQFFK